MRKTKICNFVGAEFLCPVRAGNDAFFCNSVVVRHICPVQQTAVMCAVEITHTGYTAGSCILDQRAHFHAVRRQVIVFQHRLHIFDHHIIVIIRRCIELHFLLQLFPPAEIVGVFLCVVHNLTTL